MSDRVHAGRQACKLLEISVRTAQSKQEIADAAAIYVRAGRAAFTWRSANYFQADDFKRFAEDEEVWLAFFGATAVATLSFFLPDCFVHSLYVDADAQRLGIGSALVRKVRSERPGPLTLKVDASNKAAIAFYERTGWKREGGPSGIGVDEFGISWLRLRLD